MAKYLFIYHGGKHPETEEEVAAVMDAWGNWLGSMGSAVIDGGNPVGKSSTVNPDGSVADNGGGSRFVICLRPGHHPRVRSGSKPTAIDYL